MAILKAVLLASIACLSGTSCFGQDSFCVAFRDNSRPPRRFSQPTLHSPCFTQALGSGCTLLPPGACLGKNVTLRFRYRGQTISFDSLNYGFVKYNWTIVAFPSK